MDQQRYKKLLQVGNIVVVVLTIFVNALAVILPLNGKTTQELSDALPNLFVPAGITFSIWGIIYLLMIVFALYQGSDLFKKDQQEMPFVHTIGYWFILSGIANMAWIFSWQYQYVALSLVFMLILLVSLLVIYEKLKIGRSQVTLREKLGVHLLFSVYLGWITVATIANVTAVLVSAHWNGFGISPEIWMIVVLMVASLITMLMLFLRKDIAYGLVVIWAALGIVIKRTTPEFANSTVATTAELVIVVVLIGMVISLVQQWYKKRRMAKMA